MSSFARSLPILPTDDMDGLRLEGLGRIPRCEGCPRYVALCTAYLASRAAGPLPAGLPDVPGYCHTPYCAPLAVRYVGAVVAA